MSEPSFVGVVAPTLLLIVVLATGVWVYVDAQPKRERGTPASTAYGTFTVDTLNVWFRGCLLLQIVFFPLYLAARDR